MLFPSVEGYMLKNTNDIIKTIFQRLHQAETRSLVQQSHQLLFRTRTSANDNESPFSLQLTAAATSRLFGRGFRNRSLDLWTFCIPISFRSTGARRKSSLWPPSISASVHQLVNSLTLNYSYPYAVNIYLHLG